MAVYKFFLGMKEKEERKAYLFMSRDKPTPHVYPKFRYVVGPFGSPEAAVKYAQGNKMILAIDKDIPFSEELSRYVHDNPKIPEEVLEWREEQRKGSIMKPKTFKAIERKAKRKGYAVPRAVAGKAYWMTVKTKYRQVLHDYVVKEILRGDRPYARIADDLVRTTKGGLTWGQANKFVKEVWNEMGGMKKNKGYAVPRAVAGKAYWRTVEAKFREALEKYVVRSLLKNYLTKRIVEGIVEMTKGGLSSKQARQFIKEVIRKLEKENILLRGQLYLDKEKKKKNPTSLRVRLDIHRGRLEEAKLLKGKKLRKADVVYHMKEVAAIKAEMKKKRQKKNPSDKFFSVDLGIAEKIISEGRSYKRGWSEEGTVESGPMGGSLKGFRLGKYRLEESRNGSIHLFGPRRDDFRQIYNSSSGTKDPRVRKIVEIFRVMKMNFDPSSFATLAGASAVGTMVAKKLLGNPEKRKHTYYISLIKDLKGKEVFIEGRRVAEIYVSKKAPTLEEFGSIWYKVIGPFKTWKALHIFIKKNVKLYHIRNLEEYGFKMMNPPAGAVIGKKLLGNPKEMWYLGFAHVRKGRSKFLRLFMYGKEPLKKDFPEFATILGPWKTSEAARSWAKKKNLLITLSPSSYPSISYLNKLSGNPSKGKIYIGIVSSSEREIFRSIVTPTQEAFPQYGAVIGPFRTKRAALLMKVPGSMYQTVGQAERVGRIKKNPPKGAVKIYDDILAIEAKKGDESLWPGERFRHGFKTRKGKASIFGLPDGSLLVKGKKKLWKNFSYPERRV